MSDSDATGDASTATRRSYLVAAGGAAAGLAGLAGCLDGGDGGDGGAGDADADGTAAATRDDEKRTDVGSTTPDDSESFADGAEEGWTRADPPTDAALYDVVLSREGPYVVGEGGALLARANGLWELVGQGDVAATSNALYGAALTADRRHVWFAGDAGALGVFDLDTLTLRDYSAPMGMTSSWADVAAAGAAGGESVWVANGSGQVLRGRLDGVAVDWFDVRKPGAGSSFTAAEFVDADTGFLATGAGTVFATADGGRNWRRIGIHGAGGALFDVAAAGPGHVHVAGAGGDIYRYNGRTWTTLSAGDADVNALVFDADRGGYAVDAAGAVYVYAAGEWDEHARPATDALEGVAFGTASSPQVAVGDDGTIVERFGATDDG
ncbi:WD40/YVTN/BNR-like repeat-containing protein [Halobaculum sp. P14]|uniref:WD40/YVTN/BNR-like repeat-containing protein n=1 Tax=Halobaculum sp. P14 TaxID=3421638 RepID=UPI003EB9ABB9